MKITLILFSILTLLFYGCESNYEQGINLIKEKKYEEALSALEKVKKEDKDYRLIQSKIHYVKGAIYFKSNKIDSAYSELLNVPSNDEFGSEVKLLIEQIRKNPLFIYYEGMEFLKNNSLDSAYTKFSKIEEHDSIFFKATQKIKYIVGIEQYEKGNYSAAILNLSLIKESDEIYSEARKALDISFNYIFAQEIIEYLVKANEVTLDGNNYSDNKITLSRYKKIQEQLNVTMNESSNPDAELNKFKSVLIDFLGSCIERIEYWCSLYENYMLGKYFPNVRDFNLAWFQQKNRFDAESRKFRLELYNLNEECKSKYNPSFNKNKNENMNEDIEGEE